VFDTARSAPPEEIGSPDFDPGQGPQWSTYQPEGLLADMLERESGEGSQWERLERIGAWERIVAWAQANRTVRFTRYTVLVSVTRACLPDLGLGCGRSRRCMIAMI
jgi:hypothetical protein